MVHDTLSCLTPAVSVTVGGPGAGCRAIFVLVAEGVPSGAFVLVAITRTTYSVPPVSPVMSAVSVPVPVMVFCPWVLLLVSLVGKSLFPDFHCTL